MPLILKVAYDDHAGRKTENAVRQRIRDAKNQGRLSPAQFDGKRQYFDRDEFLEWATHETRWPELAKEFGVPLQNGRVADEYAIPLEMACSVHVTPERPANEAALWDEYVDLYNRHRELKRSNADLQRDLDAVRESLDACQRRLKYGKRT